MSMALVSKRRVESPDLGWLGLLYLWACLGGNAALGPHCSHVHYLLQLPVPRDLRRLQGFNGWALNLIMC